MVESAASHVQLLFATVFHRALGLSSSLFHVNDFEQCLKRQHGHIRGGYMRIGRIYHIFKCLLSKTPFNSPYEQRQPYIWCHRDIPPFVTYFFLFFFRTLLKQLQKVLLKLQIFQLFFHLKTIAGWFLPYNSKLTCVETDRFYFNSYLLF